MHLFHRILCSLGRPQVHPLPIEPDKAVRAPFRKGVRGVRSRAESLVTEGRIGKRLFLRGCVLIPTPART